MGLKLITVYGTKWKKPDDLPNVLSSRKISHPLLYDPEGAYLKSLNLEGWPIATLLDGDGKVAWQGQSGYSTFEAGCEAAIKSVLAANPPMDAGSDGAPR